MTVVRPPLVPFALLAAACAAAPQPANACVVDSDRVWLELPDQGRVEMGTPRDQFARNIAPHHAPFGFLSHGSLRRVASDGTVLWQLPELVSREALLRRSLPERVLLAFDFYFNPHYHCIGGDRAVLAVAGDRLFVVEYPSEECGAYAFGLDLRTAEILWEHPVVGVGPMAHSLYSNRVELSIVDGNLHVLGDEYAGRYCEVIDPDGKRLSTSRR